MVTPTKYVPVESMSEPTSADGSNLLQGQEFRHIGRWPTSVPTPTPTPGVGIPTPTVSADVGSDADASTLTPTGMNPTSGRWNSDADAVGRCRF